jgi:pyridoxal phosphate enzyme (YggS family)
MPFNFTSYKSIVNSAQGANVVVVSKTKPIEDILEAYHYGVRDFGENYVQELLEKQAVLPKDIRWHFIGHLQRNKVKYIAPFVHLIHSVDTWELVDEINKQGKRNNRVISYLFQIHIAQEETKYGFLFDDLLGGLNMFHNKSHLFSQPLGIMGMASLTTDKNQINEEFNYLRQVLNTIQETNLFFGLNPILSMGMSSDWKLATENGSNMLRIGSLVFGSR